MRHGVGRPRHLYDVTPAAQELFPANYDGLATGLLAAIGAMGGEDLIEDRFAARRRQLGERMQQRLAERLGPDASLGEAVRELAVFQDEQGYLCESDLGAGGVLWLRQFNCAIHHVARETPAACAAELALFREVLGAARRARVTHRGGRSQLQLPHRGGPDRRRKPPDRAEPVRVRRRCRYRHGFTTSSGRMSPRGRRSIRAVRRPGRDSQSQSTAPVASRRSLTPFAEAVAGSRPSPRRTRSGAVGRPAGIAPHAVADTSETADDVARPETSGSTPAHQFPAGAGAPLECERPLDDQAGNRSSAPR